MRNRITPNTDTFYAVIKSNVACVVARLAFLFYCALTMGRCNVFLTYFLKSYEIGVLWFIFPGYAISCDYGLTYNDEH